MLNIKHLTSTVIFCSALLAGCNSTVHKKATLGDVKTLSVDAKQRLVHVKERVNKDGKVKNVYCAEPSPDALAATAASLSGQAVLPQSISAKAAAAFNETAASIGLRTQTIQILRDGYYRVCEAYANGAIDEDEYESILNHVDGVIAVTLAIDTLGGTVAAPAIAIAAGATEANTTADGTAAKTQPVNIAIEGLITERGSLSDAQAKAIENIMKMYLEQIKYRTEKGAELKIKLKRAGIE